MYPVYGAATIPASSYRLAEGPITTIVVPNFLLATDAMPDNVAEALTRALFASQPRLITANPAARAIDLRSAIETSPIPLHPGATTYYRTEKL
jgi:TRAP transporter TAXI family solute receptor